MVPEDHDGLENAEKRFSGIGVSSGIALAHAHVRNNYFVEPDKYIIDDEAKDEEISRLEKAIAGTKEQIGSLKDQVREAAGSEGEENIFDAHLLVLEDKVVLDEVRKNVREDNFNIEYAFYKTMSHYIEALRKIGDRYLRERVVDVEDVMRRVLRNLASGEKAEYSARHDHVLVVPELTPSDTAQMNHSLVQGFATEIGSYTSHAAIIARSLGLPAVVGINRFCEEVHTGDQLLIDGYNGVVFINPSASTLSEYEILKKEKDKLREGLEEFINKDAETKDGREIILSANIEFAYESDLAKKNGAKGIGLFRTEFFYMNTSGAPDEEEQFQTYSEVADTVDPNTVIIRTLDIGGDKLQNNSIKPELNPFLGWRGVRVSLDRPELFKVQLRAILRAAAFSKVGIMFPMISTLKELKQAKELLNEAENELIDAGVTYERPAEIGAMIEVPSAALIADQLAKEVDFFSVGTNDLIQYTMAVDRINERVSDLYQPLNPAVVRLLKETINAGHDAGIWVGVCGEMASDLFFTPLLIGLGFDELSVGAPRVPAIKHAIRSLDYEVCKSMAEAALCDASPDQIFRRCEKIALESYPEMLG
ncbi:MAG TPA: phosphoenolpyruvate--protein phosphotransferase [Verrucomicrobiales bacterium]|nr:phosphoenolpyruvate--protein phosphotransferase [Verrucomicrobiales bacterium]